MPPTVDWRAIGVFTATVLVLPWLLTAPFLLGGVDFEGPVALAVALGMMWTPTVATGLVLLTVDRGPAKARRTGLGVPGAGRDSRRWLVWLGVLALASAIPVALNHAAPFVNATLGLAELDLINFSGFRALLEKQLGDLPVEQALGGVPLWVAVAVTPLNALVGGVLNVVLGAFGEEWGWRGWLLPKLRPLGTWPALLGSGALWGIWHAPLILLGHNYPDAPVLGVFLFLPFCMLWGVLHGWTRLITGSVWPAALMHGTLNASGGFTVMLHDADSPFDPVWDAPLGVAGWILPGLVIGGLVLARQLPPRVEPDRDRPPSPTTAPS